MNNRRGFLKSACWAVVGIALPGAAIARFTDPVEMTGARHFVFKDCEEFIRKMPSNFTLVHPDGSVIEFSAPSIDFDRLIPA